MVVSITGKKPSMVIECKKANSNLTNKNSNQLNEYFENQKQVIKELLRVTKKHLFYNIQMLSANKKTIFKLFGYFNEQIKEIIIWCEE